MRGLILDNRTGAPVGSETYEDALRWARWSLDRDPANAKMVIDRLGVSGAADVTNNAEGGSDGTTVTTSNSGGTSGTAWDSVSIGTNCAATFSNTQAAHGTLSYKMSSGVSSASVALQWSSGTLGTLTDHYGRFYLYYTANPPGNQRFAQFLLSGVLTGGIRINSTGKFVCLNAANGASATSTNSIPLNQWFRLEYHVIHSTTVGQIELKMFSSMDSTSVTETLTTAANLNTNTGCDTLQFGSTLNLASVTAFYVDDIEAGRTSGYPGPAVSAVTVTLDTSAAVAAATVALTAQTTVALGSSAAVAAATLALTAATQVPLATAAAVSAATLALTAATQIPLTAAAATSATSLAITAQTGVPLDASAATSSASLALTAATQVPLAAAAATSTASLALTAPTSVPLGASAAVSSATLAIGAPTAVALGASVAQASATLALSAPTTIPLGNADCASAASLALTAATTIALGVASATSTATAAVTAATSITIGASTAASAATITLTAPLNLTLSTAAASSAATLAMTAPTEVTLSTSVAVSTTTIEITSPRLVPLGACSVVSTASLTVGQFLPLTGQTGFIGGSVTGRVDGQTVTGRITRSISGTVA